MCQSKGQCVCVCVCVCVLAIPYLSASHIEVDYPGVEESVALHITNIAPEIIILLVIIAIIY